MHITHLSLTNFRNYVHLELDPPARLAVFHGDNAQGKTNLLESVFYLATTRSPRASSDRELVNWLAQNDDLPFAKIAGRVRKATSPVEVDITLMAKQEEDGSGNGSLPSLAKRIRVNGLPKRVVDLFGLINVVMFSPQDIELVSGSPQLRRRYLDIMNSQIDPQYLRSLQHYSRVLVQRNHLLRLIRDRHARQDQLTFWDEQLVESGAYLLARRLQTVDDLNDLMQVLHPRLTGRQERLKASYLSSVEESAAKGELALALSARRSSYDQEDLLHVMLAESSPAKVTSEIKTTFREGLERVFAREVAQGMSILGPHRDDLQLCADGIDLNVYGSRGQQRTAALSLKLAEARLMHAVTGERPILLLDDIMSELDAERRSHLLEAIDHDEQVLVTTTDLDRFGASFLAEASIFKVVGGQVEKVAH